MYVYIRYMQLHGTIQYGTALVLKYFFSRFVQILVVGSFDVTTYLAFHYWKFYCVSSWTCSPRFAHFKRFGGCSRVS